MKKKLKSLKLISLVMSFIVLLMTFPFGVVAETAEEDGEVLNEVVELREENVKHFENPDGSYTAIMYNNAVHRKDSNGNWQDIDNTMSENTVKNKQAYITSDGRTVFAKKINTTSNEIYTLSENSYKITVSFPSENLKNTTVKLSNHAKKYTPTGEDSIDTQYKKLKEIDTNTTLLYKNALKGVDFEYVLSVNDIKENIIVRALQDEYSYTFIYSLEGLEATLNEDGYVTLADIQSKEEKYSIPAPYMYDANGNISYDVEYSLDLLENGDYSLTVSASKDWISSATLPITIDPTITTVSLSACPYDTYIDSNNPDTNYGNSRDMYVSSSQIVYMRPSSLYSLPDDATVTNVTLNMYYYFPDSASSSIDLYVYPVIVSWNEQTWTYNTAIQYSYLGVEYRDVGYTYLVASSTSSKDSPDFTLVDITDIYTSAYAGEPFYGMAFVCASGTTSRASILSGETSTDIRATYDLHYQRDAILENGTYILENMEFGKRFIQLDNNGENFTELWDFDGTDAQKWNIEYLHNGYYKITEFTSNLALTVPSGKTNSSNVALVTEAYGVLTRQQWNVTSAGTDTYKLSPRSNSSLYVAVGDAITVNGRNVEQRENQSDGKDEWNLHKIGTDVMMLGVSSTEGFDHDHVSCFYDCMNYFEEASFNEFNIINTNYISSSSCLSQMKRAKIFISRSHGGADSEKTWLKLFDSETESRLHSSDIYNFSTSTANVNFSNLELLLYIGCKTAFGGNTGNNLITASVNAGADYALGFGENIDCNGANTWTVYFCKYYTSGQSVYDAAQNAATDTASDHFILESVGELGTDSFSIAHQN